MTAAYRLRVLVDDDEEPLGRLIARTLRERDVVALTSARDLGGRFRAPT